MARVGRRWRNFGCAGSGFRTEGGDPGEKCFTLTPTEIGGDNGSRLLWSKRRSQMKPRCALALILLLVAPMAYSKDERSKAEKQVAKQAFNAREEFSR